MRTSQPRNFTYKKSNIDEILKSPQQYLELRLGFMLILVTSVRPHVRLWPASVALPQAASYVTRLDPGRRRKQTRHTTVCSQEATEGGH